MDVCKCLHYIGHLRKVVPRVLEVNAGPALEIMGPRQSDLGGPFRKLTAFFPCAQKHKHTFICSLCKKMAYTMHGTRLTLLLYYLLCVCILLFLQCIVQTIYEAICECVKLWLIYAIVAIMIIFNPLQSLATTWSSWQSIAYTL